MFNQSVIENLYRSPNVIQERRGIVKKLRMKDVSLIILKNDSFLVKHKKTAVIFVKTFNSYRPNSAITQNW